MESILTSAAQRDVSARSPDELWLDVLQQVSARTAHELRGALNGVSVNLEVVRSRSARSDAAAASVAPFAASASDQLEAVVAMAEALLKLARPAREPVDLGETIDAFAALMVPSARAQGGSLRIEMPGREVGGGLVRARGNVVRLVIAATLLAALSRKGDIRCRVEMGEEAVVGIECVDAEGPLELSPEVLAVAEAADIRVQREGQSISLAFPRAGAARQRTPERA